MINIILACQYGASTGMLCERIKIAAKEAGEEAVVNAYSYTDIGGYIDSADIVLLGPQVRFQLNQLSKKYADKGVPFMVIDTLAYGKMDGEKILKDAKSKVEEYQKETER